MDAYQPNSLIYDDQMQIKAALEAAQLNADRKQKTFGITKSLVIFEVTNHNLGEAVEIVQPRMRKFYVNFSK